MWGCVGLTALRCMIDVYIIKYMKIFQLLSACATSSADLTELFFSQWPVDWTCRQSQCGPPSDWCCPPTFRSGVVGCNCPPLIGRLDDRRDPSKKHPSCPSGAAESRRHRHDSGRVFVFKLKEKREELLTWTRVSQSVLTVQLWRTSNWHAQTTLQRLNLELLLRFWS